MTAGLEMVSVVFTDLVGSTSASARLGPAVADQLRQEHFSVLREAIAETGGREVKNLGDGLMVVYGSAASAVAGTVAMQQRIERRNRGAEEQLGVRVGVSIGDATCEEGDYFGPPVVEAARLCSHAGGGQILTTELVRMMVAARGEIRFEPVGELALKGLPEPVQGIEVAWEPVAADVGAMPLPARLRGVPPIAYVGRRAEREGLAFLWEEARSGSRRTVLISGDPGIGKTRIATHMAIEAHSQGATVLYGRCSEDLGVPYEPWVEALSHFVKNAPEGVLAAHVERHGGELTRLAPSLSRRVGGPLPRESDPETERYMLFGAVAGLLGEASAEAPIVLVLDDLHWADKPTLLLLKHLIAAGEDASLLVLGTYRGSDLTRGHPLTEVLADLRREEGVQRVSLGGLDTEDVVSIMEAAAGHELDATGRSLAAEVARETDGNPFFVTELLRHLSESGSIGQGADGRWRLRGTVAELGLPQSVREVIDRRLERLSDETRRALSVASVIGREFDIDLLAGATSVAESKLLDLLDEAIGASVIAESGTVVGRFSFAHALVNHTLYEALGRTRRARVHLRVAQALEELSGEEPGSCLGELAHHWAQATRSVDQSKAVGYARRAGERALAVLAPDEALRWLGQALDLLGQSPSDPHERCDLLIGLGDAQRQAGDPEFRETLLTASRLALDLGDADRLARAALANNRGVQSNFGSVDEERIAMLSAALELAGNADPARRARLLALLALESLWAGDLEGRIELVREAQKLADASGDARTIVHVLYGASVAMWVPNLLDERLAINARLRRLADELGDPVLQFWANYASLFASAEAADFAAVEEAAERIAVTSLEIGQPVMRWTKLWVDAALLEYRGRLAQAEATMEQAAQVGADHGEPDALMIYAAQLGCLRADADQVEETVELMQQGSEDNPGLPAFRGALGLHLCLAGRTDEARALLTHAVEHRLDFVTYDLAYLLTLSYYADVAVRLADPAAAALLYERLAPWHAHISAVGPVIHGPVAHWLGALAAILGDEPATDTHFGEALTIERATGSEPWLARTQYLWGAALLKRDAPADQNRGRAMQYEAQRTATAIGLAELPRPVAQTNAAKP